MVKPYEPLYSDLICVHLCGKLAKQYIKKGSLYMFNDYGIYFMNAKQEKAMDITI